MKINSLVHIRNIHIKKMQMEKKISVNTTNAIGFGSTDVECVELKEKKKREKREKKRRKKTNALHLLLRL